MKTLIVSANLLFLEAISETISSRSKSELSSALPPDALERIRQIQPDVILIDEDISTDVFEKILVGVRRMEKTRLILLNCLDNGLTILDALQSTIGSVEDLIQSIEMKDVRHES